MKILVCFTCLIFSQLSLFGQNRKPVAPTEISTVICEDDICVVNKNPNIIETDAQKVTNRLIYMLNLKKANKEFISPECEHPTFMYFYYREGANNPRIQAAMGDARGVSVNIKRPGSCDVNKDPVAVPITFRSRNYFVVTSKTGNAVLVDTCFFSILIDPKRWCYGLPAEPTRTSSCKYCGKSYSSQLFFAHYSESNTDTFNTVYPSKISMRCTKGGYHDNLKLVDTHVCGVDATGDVESPYRRRK